MPEARICPDETGHSRPATGNSAVSYGAEDSRPAAVTMFGVTPTACMRWKIYAGEQVLLRH